MTEESSFEMESEESVCINEVTSIKTVLQTNLPAMLVVGPPDDDEEIAIETDSDLAKKEDPGQKEASSCVCQSPSPPPKTDSSSKPPSQQRKPRNLSPSSLPILSRDTTNPNTFDLDYLLHPEVQKRAREGHRFTAGSPRGAGGKGGSGRGSFVARKEGEGEGRRQSPEVKHAEHLLSYKHIYESRVKALEDHHNASTMKECTFQPRVNSPSARPRSPDEFYSDMTAFQQNRNDRVAKLKEEFEELADASQYSFQPAICPNTYKLSPSTNEPVFTRLHRSPGKSRAVKDLVRPLSRASAFLTTVESSSDSDAPPSFSPRINPASKRLVRQGSISDRLLKDAKRRTERQVELPPRPGSPSPDPKSRDIVMNRFRNEVKTAVGTEETLSYLRVKEAMMQLRLVEEDEGSKELCARFWTVLSKNSTEIPTSLFVSALDSLMRYSSSPAFPTLHHDFYPLFTNRTHLHRPRPASPSPPALHSSAGGPVGVQQQSECVERLIKHQKKVGEKVEAIRHMIDKEEQERCSFAPKVNGKIPKAARRAASSRTSPTSSLSDEYRKLVSSSKSRNSALNSLALIEQQRKCALYCSPAEAEVARHSPDCTFSPRILPTRPPTDPIKPAKGVSQTIDRIAKARIDAEWKAVVREKGRPNSPSLQKERKKWEEGRKSPQLCS